MNSGVCVSRHIRLGNYSRESKKISYYLERIYKKYKKNKFFVKRGLIFSDDSIIITLAL